MFSSKTEWSFIDQQCDVGEQSSPICNVPNHGTANDTIVHMYMYRRVVVYRRIYVHILVCRRIVARAAVSCTSSDK